MPSQFKQCPRCRGTGNVGCRKDGGICYRCGGAGKTFNPDWRPAPPPVLPPAPSHTAEEIARMKADNPDGAWLIDLFTA